MRFDTMAVTMREAGPAEVLDFRACALDWDPDGDGVLVRLKAASVNPADLYFRAYGPYLGEAAGCVLGHDGAGIVEAVGARARGISVGDRVAFCNGGVGGTPGTYSQHAVVPCHLLVRVPDDVALEQAAAAALVFITGWEALKERARVKRGDKVLIHAGAGGTGHVAIQIARELGARVATTISTPEKAEIATASGAERVIDYRTEDFTEAMARWTRGRGVKAVLDNAGEEVFRQSLKVLAPYGHLVTLMGMPGDLADGTAYNNNLTIHNVMMLTPMWKGLESHRRRQARILDRAVQWLRDGRLAVRIQARFPLAEAADAHRLLESGGGSGKIVLTM